VKNEFTGALYNEVLPDVVLSVIGRSGVLFGIGQDTSILERFMLGGQRLRGFETSGVGPRDLDTGDALGGNMYYTGTVELEFPLGLPEDLGLRGRLFGEAGSLFGLDNDRVINSSGNLVNVANDTAIRASVGVGVSWTSPFGPITVDLGFPVVKEDYDKEQLVFFSFGSQF
jgi:outer membrane protein insertion porin family